MVGKMLEQSATDTRTLAPCGRSLVQLYRELGYTGELSEDLFDTLFGLPSLRIQAFLEWFLSSIRPRQSLKKVLGKNDYGIFREILDQNDGELLYGDALLREEATCRDEIIEKDESLDVLLATNDELSMEVEELEKNLKITQDKNNRLAKMVQIKTQQVENQSKNLRQVDGISYFKELLHQERESDHKKIGSALDDWLLHLSTPHQMDTSLKSHANLLGTKGYKDFLFQQRLTGLREKERKVLQEINQLIPSRISKSFASPKEDQDQEDQDHEDQDDQEDQDKNKKEIIWLHESDPNSLHLSEKDAYIFNKCSVELARLEKAFILGEKDFLQAKILDEMVESRFKRLESYELLIQQYELMSQEAIESKQKEFQKKIVHTKQHVEKFFNEKIHHVLQDLAFLNSTMILQGNYEQKLWRQEKKFNQMNKALDKLLQQTSRLQLIHVLLEKEWEDLHQVQRLIQEIVHSIDIDEATIQARLVAYEQHQSHLLLNAGGGSGSTEYQRKNAGVGVGGRISVKHSDHITHAIYDYLFTNDYELEEQQKKKRLLTFDEVVRLAEKKRSDYRKKCDQMNSLIKESQLLFETRRQQVDLLREQLFGDQLSTVPSLVPVHVKDQLVQAEKEKEQMEQNFYQTMDFYQMKKRELEFQPEIRLDQEKKVKNLENTTSNVSTTK